MRKTKEQIEAERQQAAKVVAKRQQLAAIGHAQPVTRRDFISHGLLSSMGYLLMPSALSLVLRANRALAADVCPVGSDSNGIAFMMFDQSGGLPHETYFLVGKPTTGNPQGSMLPSYAGLGWNPAAETIDTNTLGYPMSSSATFTQAVINSLNTVAGGNAAAIMASASARVFCHNGTADTGSDPLSAQPTIAKIAATAAFGSNSGGQGQGGRLPPFKADPMYRSTQVTSAATLANLAKVGSLPPDMLKLMFRKAANLNDLQRVKLSRLSMGEQLAHLVGCSAQGNVDSITKQQTNPLNPLINPVYQQAFGLNAGTQATSSQAILATLAMAAVETFSPASYVIDDCDVHASNNEDVKGTELGTAVAQVLAAAFAQKRKVMIQISTDGSSRAASIRQGGAQANWGGGDTQLAITVLIYMDPNKPRAAIGQYMVGGFQDDANIATGSPGPAEVGISVAANYYKLLNGNLNGFDAIIPGGSAISKIVF